MSKATELKAKLDCHQAYYDAKKQQLNRLDMTSRKWLNRYSRLLTLSNLITALIIELNTETMIEVFADNTEETNVCEVRKRTWSQVKESKAIYRKHAECYKAADYPVHRAKRMMAYTVLITKAIARVGVR